MSKSTPTQSPAIAQLHQLFDRVLQQPTYLRLVKQIESQHQTMTHLPQPVLTTLGSLAPWLALIGGVLSVYGSVGTISFGLGASPFRSTWVEMFTGVPRFYFILTGIIQLCMGIIHLLAFPLLKTYHIRGWQLISLTVALSVLTMIMSAFFSLTSLIGAVFMQLIGLYLLFELKPLYTAKGKPDHVDAE